MAQPKNYNNQNWKSTNQANYQPKQWKKKDQNNDQNNEDVKSYNNNDNNNNNNRFEFSYEVVKGDLFTSPESSSLCHCISRDLGMGKGIAVIFKKTFGGVATLRKQKVKIGECAILLRQNRYIYYLITKERYFHKPSYYSMTQSLKYMKNHAVIHNVKHISMPKIGCGLDRLQWNKVEQIIKNVFKNTDIKITVYQL